MREIVIIGQGPSGMAAAIAAARAGAKVTVLEAKEKPARKLLMTGNGRCNISNLDPGLVDAYRTSDGAGNALVASVFERVSREETLRFFESLGLCVRSERGGLLYPVSGQASSVLAVLSSEMDRLNVRRKYREKAEAILPNGNGGWLVKTAGWQYPADAVIVCAGSRALPETGSDGSGYELLRSLGVPIVPAEPALTALICEEKYFRTMAGTRQKCRLALYAGGELLGREEGEVQWTESGISGICVFQLSRFLTRQHSPEKLRSEGKKAVVSLDLFPEKTEEEILELLEKLSQRDPKMSAASLLEGIQPSKIIPVLLQSCNILTKTNVSELLQKDLQNLAEKVKNFQVTVKGLRSFENCQICVGGAVLSAFQAGTLEAADRHLAGIFAAGEVLDADGPCGGYNLQWAWSSGIAAGLAASGSSALAAGPAASGGSVFAANCTASGGSAVTAFPCNQKGSER